MNVSAETWIIVLNWLIPCLSFALPLLYDRVSDRRKDELKQGKISFTGSLFFFGVWLLMIINTALNPIQSSLNEKVQEREAFVADSLRREDNRQSRTRDSITSNTITHLWDSIKTLRFIIEGGPEPVVSFWNQTDAVVIDSVTDTLVNRIPYKHVYLTVRISSYVATAYKVNVAVDIAALNNFGIFQKVSDAIPLADGNATLTPDSKFETHHSFYHRHEITYLYFVIHGSIRNAKNKRIPIQEFMIYDMKRKVPGIPNTEQIKMMKKLYKLR